MRLDRTKAQVGTWLGRVLARGLLRAESCVVCSRPENSGIRASRKRGRIGLDSNNHLRWYFRRVSVAFHRLSGETWPSKISETEDWDVMHFEPHSLPSAARPSG